jgi:hypothetical protein
MKQFYTVRDIEDMHAVGVVEIEIHDDVVLTDVAREKAIALGMRLNPVEPDSDSHQGQAMPRMAVSAQTKTTLATVGAGGGAMPQTPAAPPSPPALPQTPIGNDPADRIMQVKAAVVARLGTDKYNDLLDKIIPQVISQLKKQP